MPDEKTPKEIDEIYKLAPEDALELAQDWAEHFCSACSWYGTPEVWYEFIRAQLKIREEKKRSCLTN